MASEQRASRLIHDDAFARLIQAAVPNRGLVSLAKSLRSIYISASLREFLFAMQLMAASCLGQTFSATLPQASSRAEPQFTPAYEGEAITVQGRASTRPFLSGGEEWLAIQDDDAFGLVLEGSRGQFQGIVPGDSVRTRGVIAQHAGLPVLVAGEFQKFASGTPPLPKRVSIEALNSFRYLGALVSFEGSVISTQRQSNDEIVRVVGDASTIDVLAPAIKQLKIGDSVRGIGLGWQYCPAPPFNRNFQVRILRPDDLAIVETAWSFQPWELVFILGGLAALLSIWSMQRRRETRSLELWRGINETAESVLSANSPAEIAGKVNNGISKLFPGIDCAMYVHSRTNKTLDLVTPALSPAMLSVRLDGPLGGIPSGVAVCFRKRTLIAIPDTKSSAFFSDLERRGLPRSVMFVPMLAHDEAIGVLTVSHRMNVSRFEETQQTGIQHVANQAGTALYLLDQKALRERLFRTEKLSAAGQLIAGMASELRSPLSTLIQLAASLKSRAPAGDEDLSRLESQANRAYEIVNRLVAFARPDQIEVLPVDVHGLVTRVLRLRAEQRKAKGLEVHSEFVNERVFVLGAQAQMEQVFLNLLDYAEQQASGAQDIAMLIATTLIGRRISIAISYHSGLIDNRNIDPFESGSDKSMLGLGLSRGIVQSHGGDVRFVRVTQDQSRFEVELPVMEMTRTRPVVAPIAATAPMKGRRLTTLLLEPDPVAQMQILELMTKRGDRVIPATSAEEAAEIASRLPFDITFCSVRLPGLNWVEFFERVRKQVTALVLLTEGQEPELADVFQTGGAFVLSKPVDQAELNRICDVIAQRSPGFTPSVR